MQHSNELSFGDRTPSLQHNIPKGRSKIWCLTFQRKFSHGRTLIFFIFFNKPKILICDEMEIIRGHNEPHQPTDTMVNEDTTGVVRPHTCS